MTTDGDANSRGRTAEGEGDMPQQANREPLRSLHSMVDNVTVVCIIARPSSPEDGNHPSSCASDCVMAHYIDKRSHRRLGRKIINNMIT